jgi:imidazole glycerol-phosphate synthase subunit HisF
MQTKRIIPRLEIKSRNLIKGIRMEGLRIIGDPIEKAIQYYNDGADEIIYDDIVASLYNRNYDLDIIKELSENIYIPLCVGGGIKTVNDISNILNAGADKVCINTALINDPNLIYEAARIFGSQCIVTEIQAKKQRENTWYSYTLSGREYSNVNVVNWAIKSEELGSGEIVVISIDNDGINLGPDLDLIKSITSNVNIPVIAGGGIRDAKDINNVINKGGAEAVSLSHSLHFNKIKISATKVELNEMKIKVRL